MYDHLLGEIIEVHPARVVVRAGGVGYELKVPVTTSEALSTGGTAKLLTILHVQDGFPTLLGFAKESERELGRLLLSVSGVGPAMALGILSTFGPEDVASALSREDAATLKRVKGVGAKTAERLCLELRDKVGRLQLGAPDPETSRLPPESAAATDAAAALVTLGYAEKDANARVAKVLDKESELATEEIIKRVLRG